MKKILVSIFLLLLIVIIVMFVTNIDTTKATTTTLAQTIIDLSQGDTYTANNANGVYQTNNHEYRYIGGEVNNYVSFNNDLYRIIGVFDSNSTGVNANLVKLIRARTLMAATWGVYNSGPEYTTYSNYKNNWNGLDSNGATTNGTGVPANANVLLNEFYLNPTAISTYGECRDWVYVFNNNMHKTGNCANIKKYGIQSETLRNYIQPVTWYLYGYTSNDLSKQNFYQCERNNYSGCDSANSGTYSGTTTASIGLMYISDYLYASGTYEITNTTGGNTTNFVMYNWLYNGYEWTITPKVNTDNYVFYLNTSGTIVNNSSYNSYAIRPTFYLKSSVYVTGGDGSFHNPYTIACDDCNS